jgi:hypothetical protein
MNGFIFTAIVAGDLYYTDKAEYKGLPVLINCEGRDTRCNLNIRSDCSMPPGGDLEEGEEITVVGSLYVVGGVLVPYAVEITRNDEDEEDS